MSKHLLPLVGAGLLTPQPGRAQAETEVAVLARQTALLADFTARVAAAGFVPSPVPAGQDAEAYRHAHYQQLLGGDATTWYQARLNVAACAETPAPTFAQAVARAGNAR